MWKQNTYRSFFVWSSFFMVL